MKKSFVVDLRHLPTTQADVLIDGLKLARDRYYDDVKYWSRQVTIGKWTDPLLANAYENDARTHLVATEKLLRECFGYASRVERMVRG